MTAARIAQSGEPQPRIQQYNPATSYQTANPQQLQAAGITPIVINDRSRTLRNFRPNSLSSIELEPLQTTSHANLPHPSSRNGLSQLSPYHQQILPRRSPPQVSCFIGRLFTFISLIPRIMLTDREIPITIQTVPHTLKVQIIICGIKDRLSVISHHRTVRD